MTIGEAFNASVAYYDEWMKKALPGYADLFGTAQRLLPFDTQAPIRVLDLGAGTGLFSQFILERYPLAQFVLCDLAEKMLDVAKQRFQNSNGRFKYLIQDYRELDFTDEFDVVISSLSIHHLTHEDKQALFKRVYRMLRSPGVFINIDQIKGETQTLRDLYWSHWLERVRWQGATEQQIKESIERRQTYDIDASLSDQLEWLRQANFVDVDCVYKNYFVGVFYGKKS
jgi:tRNA (cmo5U34)-methyltransferase